MYSQKLEQSHRSRLAALPYVDFCQDVLYSRATRRLIAGAMELEIKFPLHVKLLVKHAYRLPKFRRLVP